MRVPSDLSNKTKSRMKRSIIITVFLLFSAHILIQSQTKSLELNKKIFKAAEAQVQKTNELYIDLHQTPELSLMEFKTAEKMAYQLPGAAVQDSFKIAMENTKRVLFFPKIFPLVTK